MKEPLHCKITSWVRTGFGRLVSGLRLWVSSVYVPCGGTCASEGPYSWTIGAPQKSTVPYSCPSSRPAQDDSKPLLVQHAGLQRRLQRNATSAHWPWLKRAALVSDPGTLTA